MLRRKLVDGFVCLQCRLQSRALSASAQRPYTAAPGRKRRPSLEKSTPQKPNAPNNAVYGRDQFLDDFLGPGASRDPPFQLFQQPDDAFERTDRAEPSKPIELPTDDFIEDRNQIPECDHSPAPDIRYVTELEPESAPLEFSSRGRRLRVKDENLPVDMLGGPGAAIVLRQTSTPKRKKKNEKGSKAPPNPEAERSVHLAEILNKETAEQGFKDAIMNIEELRPKDTRILPAAFDELSKALETGFTTSQLKFYIANWLPISMMANPTGKPSSEPPWIISRQPWVPLTPQKATSGSAKRKPKGRLVVQLIQECWGVFSEPFTKSSGRLDLRLREAEFGLLLMGDRRYLRQITDRVLEEGTTVEMQSESHTISIFAPRAKAEAILLEINNLLARSKTISFSTSIVTSEPLDPTVLDDLSRITNSLVRLNPSGDRVFVTWVHSGTPGEGREDIGDIVLRYLLYAFRPNPRLTTGFREAPSLLFPDAGTTGRYIVQPDCKSQLPWHQRRTQWARRLHPMGSKKVPTKYHHIHPEMLPLPIQTNPNKANTDCHRKTDLGGWYAEIRTDTRAVFGHLLFGNTKDEPPNSEINQKLPRTFLPGMPPVLGSNFPLNLKETPHLHAIIILRFIPDPRDSHTTPPPPLELRIETLDTKILGTASLRAITSSHTLDAAFPSAPVDVRIHQDQYYQLRAKDIEPHAKPIMDFIKASDLRPWDGVISTPALVKGLKLPRGIIQPTGEAELDSIDELVETNYIFAAADIQRTVTTEYSGFKLAYRSTQSGQRGGKTAEVSLEDVPIAKNSTTEEEMTPLPTTHSLRKKNRGPPNIKKDPEGWLTVVSALPYQLVFERS
ncbi:hypothetical protein OQA88_7316 [Cercophora sp. LCS_1]